MFSMYQDVGGFKSSSFVYLYILVQYGIEIIEMILIVNNLVAIHDKANMVGILQYKT